MIGLQQRVAASAMRACISLLDYPNWAQLDFAVGKRVDPYKRVVL